MKKSIRYRPPLLMRILLKWSMGDGENEILIGDMRELFDHYARTEGRSRACLWYFDQVIRIAPLRWLNRLYWGGIMFKNYFKIMARKILREKGYSIINITGLAIGLTCFVLIFMWVQDELSYDRFHKNHRLIHRVVENQIYSDGKDFPVAVTPGPLAKYLTDTYPEIEYALRIQNVGNILFRRDNIQFYESGVMFTEKPFFKMFTFPFVAGDPETALDNMLSIVLTEKLAHKYFGDENPIGKTMNIESLADVVVQGVIRDVPENSHLRFTMVLPIELMRMAGFTMDSWGNNQLYTYIQLKSGADASATDEKIRGVIGEKDPGSSTTLHLQPLIRIHLHSDFTADIGGHGDIRYIYIFASIALFVLIIACINFMNLTTARSGNRAKEVGLRKVTGALRRDLGRQFLGESIMMAFLAMILALCIIVLILPGFNQLSGKHLSMNPASNRILYLVLLASTLITGLLSGSYPAFFLSSFQPVQVLRGGIQAGARGKGLRRVLVTLQFGLSIILIVSTFLIHQQLSFMQNKDLGFDKEQLMVISQGRNPASYYNSLKTELLKNPRILNVTHTDALPTYMGSSTTGFSWSGKDPESKVLMHFASVGYDFIETFEMAMAEGRSFTDEFSTDNLHFIINETAAEIMKEGGKPGKILTMWGDQGTIAGVVKDFHFKSLTHQVEPLVMMLQGPQDFMDMVIRIQADDVSGAVSDVEAVWEKQVPQYPFRYRFLDQDFDALYRAEQRMETLFDVFSVLAVFIGCLGLLGLASYMAEQRTKEIGVRKVLGATISQIVMLVSREFLILVALANLLAWPVAFWIMRNWLGHFAYRIAITWIPFVLAALAALLVSMLTVSYQAWAAARRNPADALRHE